MIHMGRGFVDSEGERRKSRSGEPKTYRESARNAEEINGRDKTRTMLKTTIDSENNETKN